MKECSAERIVFVGGIHGAGKTTLGRRVAELLGMEHLTAGALIRAAATSSEVLSTGIGGKAVLDIDANQDRLLRGLRAHRSRRRSDRAGILMDGHFCLIDANQEVAAIPHAVFEAMCPTALVLVEADVATVAHRLAARDGEALPADIVGLLTVREVAHATAVASRLQVPLYRVRGDMDTESAATLLASRLASHVTVETS